ncbi:hypothetical protein [Chryseobacterium sp. 2R14A]|uniref:hypothetical protein n=1 Tax=Chryseobacterium sp. 2R14A TaxID=3380353 RepID=UPI003CF75DAA
MSVRYILLLCIFFCSCSKQDSEQIFGTYTSPDNTNINRLKYGAFVLQLTLKLNEDYTYEYSTCAQKESGRWSLSNNQLSLFCEEKKFITDSLNEKYKKGKICDSVQIFSYQKGKLQRNIKILNKDYKLLLFKNQ